MLFLKNNDPVGYIAHSRQQLRESLAVFHAPGKFGVTALDGLFLETLDHNGIHRLDEYARLGKARGDYLEYALHVGLVQIHGKPLDYDKHRFGLLLYLVAPIVHGRHRYLRDIARLRHEPCTNGYSLRQIEVMPAAIARYAIASRVQPAGNVYDHCAGVIFEIVSDKSVEHYRARDNAAAHGGIAVGK